MLRLDMDDRSWSDLPRELIERIVSKLPLSSVLKLRSTCKAWRAVVAFCNTPNLGFASPSQVPYLLGTGPDCECFVGFNPVFSKWQILFLPFPVPGLRHEVYLAASARGLLCFAAIIDKEAAFFVCNPAIKSWRQLPPPALKLLPRVSFGHHFDVAICVVPDKNCESYKLIVVGNAATNWNRITQVYESRTDLWTQLGGSIPQDVDFRSYGLIYNGCVYYMMAGWSIKIMCLNVEEGIWTKLEAPLPRFLVRPRLVERKGSLLLVGGIHKFWRQGWNFLKPQSVRIWILDQINLVWVEVGRMPEDVHNKFVATLGDGIQDFRCAGQGDLLYFSSHCTSGFSVIIYNFSSNSWTCVPSPETFRPVDDIFIFNVVLGATV